MPGHSATRPQSPLKGFIAPLVITLVVALLPLTVPAALAAGPCDPVVNPVVCENSKAGSPPSEWDISGPGDDSIQGFSTEISVNAGQPIRFKIDTTAPSYTIAVYRTGWYGGLGARKVAEVTPSVLRQNQPQCLTDLTTGLYDCGTWAVSATWQVPATAVSGVYVALLTRPDTGGQSHITFIVRSDGSRSDVVFQTSDPSWQAYNSYGGSDFYQGANGRAYKVSYNRPVATRGGPGGRDFYFSNEYPMVRFLEQNGYDVSYISGLDTDRNGPQLLNHKVFLSVGHDEYWSGPQRANITAARDAGVNLQFLSGNEGYWRTRFEPSPVDGVAGRTLTSYKETWANEKIDPSPEWTGTWRDPRFAAQANGGGLPENGLTGTIYMSNYSDLPVTVDSEEGKTRLWRNTSLTSLPPGSSTALAPHTVGYESDEDLDNGFRPPGLIRLSTTVGEVPQYLQDFGNTVLPGTTTHHVTLYRAASGALVFSAGSVQWTWGLDEVHDGEGAPADPRMRQAQVNLLADMGAQPATRAAGLTAAAASTDRTAPTAAITAPVNGAAVPHGTSVTVTGTAADTGGVVAGVEVSTDGGSTWHPAVGKQNWTYTYIQKGFETATIQARAIDDSANIGAATSTSLVLSGPYSVFGQTIPTVQDSGDGGSYEMGLRFTPTVDGFITGVRFYKSAANTGTHTGSLWSSTGERLATATFTNETPSGWQSVLFSQAVPVAAGQKYTVSYWTPNGRYSIQNYQWASVGSTNAPLTVAGGFGAEPAGVYTTSPGFPTSSYNGGNYFVDALFGTADTTPMTVSGHTPFPSSSSVSVDTKVSAVFSKPVTASSVQLTLQSPAGPVAGTTAYDPATRRTTFTPTSALAFSTQYTATLAGTDTLGGPVTTGGTWSFTTAATLPVPGSCPCSLFDDSVTPGIAEIRDGVPLTLGVRFSSVSAGEVVGMRFYKSAGNTGTHNGALYTAAGQQLATVAFTNESASGWQTAMFSQPVQMSANTEYIVSYKSLTGTYSATANGFGSGMSVGPLRAASDAGAYTYSGDFPGARSTASYLVDVIVMVPPPAFTPTGQSPHPGASSVPLDSQLSAVLSEPAEASSVSLTVKDADGATVPGATSYDTGTRKATFTPAAPLAAGTSYTATVTATAVSRQPLSNASWTFATVPAPRTPGTCPCTLYQDTVTPGTPEANDGVPLSLGVRFASDTAGQVTGVRFYKAAGNTGTHTGSVYTTGGQLLATVTFTNETSVGWQTATFSQPVEITANTEYVVAYKAPAGTYSYTPAGFGDGFASGPLRTAPDSGAFSYSADFPGTASTASYLVDLVFMAAVPPLTITDRSPAPDATGVSVDVRPALTLSSAIKPGASFTLGANGAPVDGSAALSTDGRTLTFTPAAVLPGTTAISVNVSNVESRQGQTLPTTTWQFTTADPDAAQTSMFGELQPQTAASDDASSVELGTAFTVSEAGNVTGIRFYKGTGNTGTHVGSLWNAAGTRLAQVTFANETANGWQTAMLSSPVAVIPGETYVVSYLAPNGRYAYTPAFFAQTWASGVFTAAGPNNGRYLYGSGGAAPTNSWNSTNYFVDVLYSATAPAQAQATPGPTPTPTPTATPAPSATATATPSPSPTATPSPSPSPSPTQSGGLLCGLLGTC
ncbi:MULTISPECIES: DUF4082 domain-containing protein [Paenarthrobacter]|uniref:DUF4082 domain-containing protein n=1 Tax=Paenarthrobacter ureafaciens TaxID=37931 RepID=A0AAX3EJ50_PAEUR|nr:MULTISPECIES: DUF4082 domain-containing protein [Paenarthrobacter]MDO5862965.1 DUF4082 domain-containing protein [Paenarthrobacter sp. SD-2]MDO5874034.1 DUF4082 domain-containing protein [Paenarthrobacter sp. SD-1]QMU81037.1 DUF4082 domain-containing protein [Paenarthrobacter ureafaciens]UYV93470.1 DUF4082 domain-containing protein [Paenarthrobacter ureafaciens]UYV97999.1 DUF4082 domain-containing protein [Paenarthrobacter ureafaciens]